MNTLNKALTALALRQGWPSTFFDKRWKPGDLVRQ